MRSDAGPVFDRGRFEHFDRRKGTIPPLDLHETLLPAASLCEFGRALIECQDVGISMHAHRPGLSGIQRIVPRAGRELHDALANVAADDGACHTAAAVVVHAYDITVRDSTGRGIVGMHADRFPPLDLGRLTELADVQLAVQPGLWIVGDQNERKPPGELRSQPLRGIEPRRMSGTVRIAERLDSG